MVATITVVIIKYLSYKLKLLGVVPLKNTLFQEIVLPNIWQNSSGVLLETSASATAQKPLREKSGRSTYRSCLLNARPFATCTLTEREREREGGGGGGRDDEEKRRKETEKSYR